MSDWLTEAARRPVGDRCPSCDGSGDVHNIVGEWCGYCDCPAGEELKARKALPEGLHYSDDGKVMYHCHGCDQFKELEIEPAEFVHGDPNNLCGGSPRCCP